MSFPRFARGAGSYLFGTLLCLTIPTAIFLTGWVYRLAQRIITQHQGTIAVETSPQKGASFIIRIPKNAVPDS